MRHVLLVVQNMTGALGAVREIGGIKVDQDPDASGTANSRSQIRREGNRSAGIEEAGKCRTTSACRKSFSL